jgi:hypothetical protein
MFWRKAVRHSPLPSRECSTFVIVGKTSLFGYGGPGFSPAAKVRRAVGFSR